MVQNVLSAVVIIVAIFALAISKKVFPSCYWPYRIYVIVVVVLWAICQVRQQHP